MEGHKDPVQNMKHPGSGLKAAASEQAGQSGLASEQGGMAHHPGATTQLKLQQVANNSSQAGKLMQFQKTANKTGLPDNLKAGVEQLSGMSMDDVKVHYNSDKPAQLNAHAYAQGSEIHLGPGQEKHLAHEAWHTVQQKQGRVRPTMQLKGGIDINDSSALENEADRMGQVALNFKPESSQH